MRVPQEENTRERPSAADSSVPEQWESLGGTLDTLLRDAQPRPEFIHRVRLMHERASKLGQSHVDTSLYHLIHTAGHSLTTLQRHHALLVMLVCEQAATLLGWKDESVRSLGCAALTMNVAMSALQDELATTAAAPTAAQREQIQQHAQQGAQLLREAGVDDALWCDTVRLHHDAGDAQLAAGRTARRAATGAAAAPRRHLHRQDQRRRTRAPMSPVQAAREACLGPAGVPDEVGGALLRATGLYPPGSFVELANGERGIVVSRGRRANLPWVASLVAPSGMPHRRTGAARHAGSALRGALGRGQRAGEGAAGSQADSGVAVEELRCPGALLQTLTLCASCKQVCDAAIERASANRSSATGRLEVVVRQAHGLREPPAAPVRSPAMELLDDRP